MRIQIVHESSGFVNLCAFFFSEEKNYTFYSVQNEVCDLQRSEQSQDEVLLDAFRCRKLVF